MQPVHPLPLAAMPYSVARPPIVYAGEAVTFRRAPPPTRNSAAIASWLLFLFACVGAMFPGLGFGVWLIIVPILVITLILGIMSINRGGALHGVVIILMSLIVVPLFVLFAPIVSTAIALQVDTPEAAPSDTSEAYASSTDAALPTPAAATTGQLTAMANDAQVLMPAMESADDAASVPVDASPDAAFSPRSESLAASLAAVPRFDAYPALRDFEGHRVPPVIESIEERQVRPTLEAAGESSPNFAGEYNLTVWRCGDDCITGAAVNLSNGHVIFLPFTESHWKGSGNPLRYRRDSRLLVVGGMLSEQGPYGAHFFTLNGDDGFSFLKSVGAPEPDEHAMN